MQFFFHHVKNCRDAEASAINEAKRLRAIALELLQCDLYAL